MTKTSQNARVLRILKEQGYIDNFDCIKSGLTLRLGARINDLKRKGVLFDEEKSGFIPGTKNYRYYLKNWAPYTPPQIVEVDGRPVVRLTK